MEEQKEKGIWERAKYYIVLKRKLIFLGFLIWLCLLNLLGRFYRREMFFSAWIYAFLLLPLMIGIAVLSEKLENIVETILEKKMLNREEGNIWEKARNYLKHQATFMEMLLLGFLISLLMQWNGESMIKSFKKESTKILRRSSKKSCRNLIFRKDFFVPIKKQAQV